MRSPAPAAWLEFPDFTLEIGKALIDFGFRDLGLKEIIGISVSANRDTLRLAERYGFQAIGTQPGSDWMRVRDWSQVVWRLTRESWSIYGLRQ
ncbi:MAG: GNAT family N-acetyltransferase [Fischerella sp. CENA71]|nr:GNAT family N-acetyltransferase [Fischerella sp. CENA71]